MEFNRLYHGVQSSLFRLREHATSFPRMKETVCADGQGSHMFLQAKLLGRLSFQPSEYNTIGLLFPIKPAARFEGSLGYWGKNRFYSVQLRTYNENSAPVLGNAAPRLPVSHSLLDSDQVSILTRLFPHIRMPEWTSSYFLLSNGALAKGRGSGGGGLGSALSSVSIPWASILIDLSNMG
jgi:hypothetical protein